MVQRFVSAACGFFVVLASLLGVLQAADAQEVQNWVRLGSATSAGGSGTVTVTLSGRDQRFKAVRVSASEATVEILRVIVTPGGIASAARSPTTVSFSGGRAVQSLTVRYHSSLPRDRRITFEVYGQPTDAPAAAATPQQPRVIAGTRQNSSVEALQRERANEGRRAGASRPVPPAPPTIGAAPPTIGTTQPSIDRSRARRYYRSARPAHNNDDTMGSAPPSDATESSPTSPAFERGTA